MNLRKPDRVFSCAGIDRLHKSENFGDLLAQVGGPTGAGYFLKMDSWEHVCAIHHIL